MAATSTATSRKTRSADKPAISAALESEAPVSESIPVPAKKTTNAAKKPAVKKDVVKKPAVKRVAKPATAKVVKAKKVPVVKEKKVANVEKAKKKVPVAKKSTGPRKKKEKATAVSTSVDMEVEIEACATPVHTTTVETPITDSLTSVESPAVGAA
jgi:hypothetical protein|eukprot:scaffold514_cov222-Chaetoceros_neogracile.AAC.5